MNKHCGPVSETQRQLTYGDREASSFCLSVQTINPQRRQNTAVGLYLMLILSFCGVLYVYLCMWVGMCVCVRVHVCGDN